MIITAKFDSHCIKCNTPIAKDTKINWIKGVKGVTHIECPEAAKVLTSTPIQDSTPIWKKIETIFDSQCVVCKQPVFKGETVEWSKGKGVRHPEYGCKNALPELTSVTDMEIAEVLNSASTAKQINDGTYTLVRADGTYRTMRVKTEKKGPLTGKTILSFMSKSDNESDSSYTGFAFLVGQTVRIWNKYKNNPELADDSFMLALGDEAQMGLAYSLQSGRCYRCSKMLTVPASICKGLGPVCDEIINA